MGTGWAAARGGSWCCEASVNGQGVLGSGDLGLHMMARETLA